MKVILMAAGRGTRISKFIGEKPKSLVDVNGVTLLTHTIDMLKSNGITDISVIVGYKHEMIENELKNQNIKIYHNEDYMNTNSIYSLYLAKEELNDDVILANADVFWEKKLLDLVLSDKRDVVLLSDVSKADNGDYFFLTDEKNRIVDYGKTLTRENRNCEYVGIAKIDKSFVSEFKERLNDMIDNHDVNKWWENVLYSFVGEKDIFSLDVDGVFWAEVDLIEDYNKILNYVQQKQV